MRKRMHTPTRRAVRSHRVVTLPGRQTGRVRWVLPVLLLLVVLALFNARPPDPAAEVAGGPSASAVPGVPGPVRATFAGVSTILFDDGQNAILVDGFFTRPGMIRTALGRVGPDEKTIRDSLRRLGVLDGPLKLLAVITVHSHYDHAMDAPVVARLTGAMLVGSATTRFIGLGQGLDEKQIEVPDPGEILLFGPFTVRLIPSIHSPTPWNDGHDGGTLSEPLVPPAHAARYKEGGSYSLHFEHRISDQKAETPKTFWLVQGSAGYLEGVLDPVNADTVFLGVGTLGRKPTAYKESYWLETVTAVGARYVVPVHWDDFTVPLSEPLKPLPYWLDNVHSTWRFLRGKSGMDPVHIHWMGAWEQTRLPVYQTPPIPGE